MRLCRMRISTIFQEAEAYLHTSSEETEKVNEKKQLIIVFSKCLTKTRRHEARLCRARISTMF